MIDRYSRPQMAAIWEAENNFETWLKIELLACEALVEEGEIPKSALKATRSKAKVDPARIDALEKKVKHDVIAFLSSVTEKGGEDGRFLHWGMTSSDVLDTGLALMMRQAADLIIDDLLALLEVLKIKSEEYKETVMIGRSHGIHGEPI